ncbi:hypothetical protein MZM54_05085 [[Brevibacterium] frigoritolerans]|nr:hypothetical protein [Peribacillus frigoritolerans]
MKFSLIQIYKEKNGLVEGVWLQDYTGELDMAVKKANETEIANGNRIKVAVVEKITGSSPNYCLLTNLKQLR